MAPISVACCLKTSACVLANLMLAVIVYTVFVDGLPFRKDILTPWMVATLVDFYVNVVALAAWVCYKESYCISAILWVVLLVCFGSVTTCAYTALQLFNLSNEESLQDPIYYVLLRHQNKNHMGKKLKPSPVLIARVGFSVLGCLMLGTLVHTVWIDGSPFRKDLLTPWMRATLIDFYINVSVLSVWVAYRETSWISSFFWIVLLICLGSITTCVYIVQLLLQLSLQDPLYFVLLNSRARSANGYERTPN